MHPSIDKLALLRTITAFGRLHPVHLTLLAAQLGSHSFARGALIFQQGDPGDTLYLVVRGQVRIYHPTAGGRELTVALFENGDFFGELALLDNEPRSASAVALRPTTTLTLSQQTFRQILRTHPAVSEAILTELAARLRASTRYVEQLANASAQQRVAWFVLDLARRYGVADPAGVRIDLALTQEELASGCGLTRETVNRMLGRLRELGLVILVHGQVLVPDCARLAGATE